MPIQNLFIYTFLKLTMKEFFKPESIAVIGASEEEKKVGGILVKKLKQFPGKLIPINPHHASIQGLKAYASILQYPEKIDLAIIAVPSFAVTSLLEECGKKKVRQAIIISAGFSEDGHREEEDRLVALAKSLDIRLLGPNCFGVCNPSYHLDATFSASSPQEGSLAFISQSGALWSFISDFSVGKFGFSGFASLGNMADIEFADCIDYFSHDKKTKAIVLYIEKLKDGKKFLEVCRKCKKPLFAVKAGSSAVGSKAAVSHTGSLATDFAVYQGVFKQAKVTLCETLEEAFSLASNRQLLPATTKRWPLTPGEKVFLITNAGGAGALASDYLSNAGFRVEKPEDLKNPWDILGTASAKEYGLALERISKMKEFDRIGIIITPQSMTDLEGIAQEIINARKNGAPPLFVLFLGGAHMHTLKERLERAGILCHTSLAEFKRAIQP